MMEGRGADSEEKHEPASDIDTALMDSLKVLDPEGPIREADISRGESAYAGLRVLGPLQCKRERSQPLSSRDENRVGDGRRNAGRADLADATDLGTGIDNFH